MSNLEKYNLQTAEESVSEVSDTECPFCCPCLSGCAEGYSDYD